MISRRVFLKDLTLTAAGLLVPEVVGKVFYSIPKIVVPQNLRFVDSRDIWTGNLIFGKDNWYIDGDDIVRKSSVFRVPDWNRRVR